MYAQYKYYGTRRATQSAEPENIAMQFTGIQQQQQQRETIFERLPGRFFGTRKIL